MKIAVLAGGVGGAKFLTGVKTQLGWQPTGPRPPAAADEVTAIVNTGDDIRLHGLQICPDLDSCLYTLSGQSDAERGWGRSGETWTVSGELAGYGAEAPWFSLGDKDIATHLMRTRMLDSGYPLSAVTAALAQRWEPGVTLLPMSDDRVETHVVVRDPEQPDSDIPNGDIPNNGTPNHGKPNHDEPALMALHFQEWWVRYRANLPPLSISPIGAEEATPAAGVLEAIGDADLILIAPSNPVVSIGIILAVPGISEALRAAPAPVIGVAPLIGGAPIRGYADKCLAAIGVESTAGAVGRHYGARSAGGLLDGYLVADTDSAEIPGVEVAAVPLLMSDPQATAAMVAACRRLARV